MLHAFVRRCNTAVLLGLMMNVALRRLSVIASIDAHEIVNLPGWSSELPSRQYSGLLPVANGTKHLHYWLVLSESAPEQDPLVLWLNGGPGASSLLGLLTELGPLQVDDDSMLHPTAGVPSLKYNPYSWARLASLLFIESPAGVGFSYCEVEPCLATDESTASDMADFFEAFYKAYPEFLQNQLFLTGESYAGVYLPMLAEQLLERYPDMPLEGMAVGNGCWGNQVGICSGSGDSMTIATTFFHAHAMFDDALWDDMQKDCDWYNVTQDCWKKVELMRKQMGTFNLYNVYDVCSHDQAGVDTDLAFWFETTPERQYRVRSEALGRVGDYRCGAETAMTVYLSNVKVAEATHVKLGTPGMRYNRTVADLRPVYRRLSDKIRVLIYSGDVDGCVPTFGTETLFLRTLGLNITQTWSPWFSYTNTGTYVRAGYHEKFTGTKHGIDFMTVAGSGHMVPQYKPAEAQTMMRRWLNGNNLQHGADAGLGRLDLDVRQRSELRQQS